MKKIIMVLLLGLALGWQGVTAQAPGGKLVFTSERDGDPEIYSMNADGSDQVNLSNHPAWDILPAWSPDGSQIAFASDRSEGTNQIFVMNADGSRVRQLTFGEFYASAPAWSPDGSQILYVGGTDTYSALYVINADGTNQRLFFDDVAGEEGAPAWWGDVVAFTSGVPGQARYLMLANADGSNAHPVFEDMAQDDSPTWSADGSQLIFQCEIDLCYTSLSFPRRFAIAPLPATGIPYSPALSPNGEWIAYEGLGEDDNSEIYVRSWDGQRVTQLTASPGYDSSPRWQPTGGAEVATAPSGAFPLRLQALDDFTTNFFAWETANIPEIRSVIEDGKYIMEFRPTDTLAYWIVMAGYGDYGAAPVMNQPYDFEVEISNFQIEGISYRVVLLLDVTRNYDTFKMLQLNYDGSYRLVRSNSDNSITGLQEGQMIRPVNFLDGNPHVIRLQVRPDAYTVLVDSVEVARMPASGAINGTIGFGLHREGKSTTYMYAEFDNAAVYVAE